MRLALGVSRPYEGKMHADFHIDILTFGGKVRS